MQVESSRLEEARRLTGAVGESPIPFLSPLSGTQRVLRQLLEALLFEELVEFELEPRGCPLPADSSGELYDRRATFRLGQHSYSCCLRVGAFGRVRIAEGSVKRVVSGRVVDAQLHELLGALDTTAENRARLRTELEQTVELCEWNARHLSQEFPLRRGLGFQELESKIVEGHLYHPSFKARTGFTLRDHESYGPEVGRRFQLEWIAVRSSSVRAALPVAQDEFLRAELGDEEFWRLKRFLLEHGYDAQAYTWMPVHPWQLKFLADRGLRTPLFGEEMVLLGPAGDEYTATQSLRTLVNVTDPRRANIKLPLGVVCTSVPRNLRRHFVCVAPALSRWLTDLVENDPFLQTHAHILLLKEYAGMLYAPSHLEQGATLLADGHLGALFRESILARLGDDEAVVPFTALMLVESDGHLFVAPWLKQYGTAEWVTRLLEVMLIPLWHMLVHHGVAFEAHAQNLLLVHRDGWPMKIALRDFHEDTEYCPEYLARPDLVPDFGAIDPYFANVPDDDGYRMGAVSDLRDLFTDTVYVFNLAELSFALERHACFPEATFWRLVRQSLDQYERSGVTHRSRIERIDCKRPTIPVESLLEKKLRGGAVLDFFSHDVPNPLHG